MPDWFRTALAEQLLAAAARPDLPAQCDGQLPLPLHFPPPPDQETP